jgi:hypothetical protein
MHVWIFWWHSYIISVNIVHFHVSQSDLDCENACLWPLILKQYMWYPSIMQEVWFWRCVWVVRFDSRPNFPIDSHLVSGNVFLRESQTEINDKHAYQTSHFLPDLRFPKQCCWHFKFSGIWCFVVRLVVLCILKDCSAFIFRVKQSKNNCHRGQEMSAFYRCSCCR